MRMSRLYLPMPLAAGQTLVLDEERAHYLRTVLRLKAGDALQLFDGRGGEYTAWLSVVSKKTVSVEIGAFDPRETESPLRIELGLGISRGERMDLAVQKAVELGVSAIHPLLTERVIARLNDHGWSQRQSHWQRIVWNACEQCGRNRVPEVTTPQPFGRWLERLPEGLRLILDPREATSLAAIQPRPGAVCLVSGPEGGFADAERELARGCGFVGIRLGPRILRTETAVFAALAAVQTLWGDFARHPA